MVNVRMATATKIECQEDRRIAYVDTIGLKFERRQRALEPGLTRA